MRKQKLPTINKKRIKQLSARAKKLKREKDKKERELKIKQEEAIKSQREFSKLLYETIPALLISAILYSMMHSTKKRSKRK